MERLRVALIDGPELAADPLERMEETVQSLFTKVREIVTEIRPPALDDFGLATAAAALFESVAEAAGMAATTEVDDALPDAPGASEQRGSDCRTFLTVPGNSGAACGSIAHRARGRPLR